MNIDKWNCEDNYCDAYNNSYSCFGYCPYGVRGEGNCGTSDWFELPMKLNPQEENVKYRQKLIDAQIDKIQEQIDKNPGDPGVGVLLGKIKDIKRNLFANPTRSWDRWQNYYTERNKLPEGLKEGNVVSIPGFGKYTVRAGKDQDVCLYCNPYNENALKPYRFYKNIPVCSSSCSIQSQNTITNQGIVVGSINLTINNQNACQNVIENNDGEINPLKEVTNLKYINYLSKNDCRAGECLKCTQEDILKNRTRDGFFCGGCGEMLDCISNSEICIQLENGDNCASCREPRGQICCTSPEDARDPEKNKELINIVGNNISYICSEECPSGTSDLKDLERTCGLECVQRTSEEECKKCRVCTWISSENKCAAMCPPGPWNIKKEPQETVPPTDDITKPPVQTRPPELPNRPIVPVDKDVDWYVNVEPWILFGSLTGVCVLVFLICVLVFFLRSK